MEAVKCEAFLAAAELGSLTATAELLGYTQSGVTRMIGTLEEELGFPLFLRSKKGVQLTENGKLMLPLLREVVRAHHNAEQLSAEIGGVSKGSLTIGCYYSISALWMPEILPAFRARYPGVTVRMQEVLQRTTIDESRILTEAAIFGDKTAVDEETVRLRSHIAQYRSILELDEPVGRKLDFLTQELNRETNTIGSKCQDLDITRIVVDMKAEIEKIREQIQNLE